jgi:hypothetical protein
VGRYWGIMARPSWSSVPAARSSLPILRIRLWLVLGTLLLTASIGLFSALAWILDEPPTVDFSDARPLAEGHALAIADAWLNGRATSLPVAEGVDPQFNESASGGLYVTIKSISPLRWTRSLVTGRTLETQYILVDGLEGDFVVALPFVFTSSGADRVPVLAAYPTLLPPDPSLPAEALEYQDVELLSDDPAPSEVQTRLEQWGKAYAANDGATLRDLADDTGALAEQYQGLGNMTLVGPPSVRAVVTTSKGLVLRVRFALLPDGAPSGLTMDLDVLVTEQNSTKPRIVAWGPPGSGPALRVFQNRR